MLRNCKDVVAERVFIWRMTMRTTFDMSRLISASIGLFLLLVHAADAAQQRAAGGRTDRLDSAATDVAIGLSPLRPTIGIEPAFAPGGVEDFIRYNLEPIDVAWDAGYDGGKFLDQTDAILWDVVGAYGIATAFGVANWDWGSSSFSFQNEGWFGRDTKYLGMDKLGHAYTGYLLTEYFTQRIAHSTQDRAGAAVTGGILGMGVQTYVEVFDGFSGGHGFSYEDLTMDGLGVGFSILRSTIPGLADKVDFRMEYLPSGDKGTFSPVTDYTGQKYLLALKLAGFDEFKETPLRFVELQVGYFARGFTEEEQERGENPRREPYVALGFNLQELLDQSAARDTTPGRIAGKALHYVELPYTYAATAQQ